MKALLNAYLDTSLVLRIGIALVLGLVVGLVGGSAVAEWLDPLGELLLRLLKFLIVPIVLFTLVVGINQANHGQHGACRPQTAWFLCAYLSPGHHGGIGGGFGVDPWQWAVADVVRDCQRSE